MLHPKHYFIEFTTCTTKAPKQCFDNSTVCNIKQIMSNSTHGEPPEGLMCLVTMEDITKEDGNYGAF